ncbi:flagellin [Roseibium aquae]|uniref:Flagellin n=1 Tax=Roseibium aquae TaxID=1323746 RepID=A0A916TLW5_9HYPH|nr:flagellar hook-associated family protein [Roseibium aquae]GGB53863.1 flagellin [Roseibium aquae]
MKTTFVSTIALSDSARAQLMKQTSLLNRLQVEMASGRKADVGLDLGGRTGEAVSLRSEFIFLNSIKDTNELTASRLDVSQAAMGDIKDTVQDLVASLIAMRDTEGSADLAANEASGAMDLFLSRLNTQLNGSYLFGGLNVDQQPMTDFFAPGAPNKAAMDAAFTAFFNAPPYSYGLTGPDDPGVSVITAADMDAFLTTDFEDVFSTTVITPPATEPNWAANWSSASDQPMTARISAQESVSSSVSANERAFRDIAAGLAMVMGTGADNLDHETFKVVVDKAIQKLGTGINSVVGLMGQLGGVQERVKNASESLSVQTDLLNKRINGLENVNPEETAIRLNTALTQLETSYAVSARMQRLSLLNYL